VTAPNGQQFVLPSLMTYGEEIDLDAENKFLFNASNKGNRT